MQFIKLHEIELLEHLNPDFLKDASIEEYIILDKKNINPAINQNTQYKNTKLPTIIENKQ